MAGVNKVILIGNLGLDPEIRTLESGAKVARLRLATTEAYTNREGQRVENVEWHNVVLWRQLAEIAEKFLVKGSQIYVEGRLRSRQYKDKEGIDRYTTEIEGNTFQMLGKRPDSGDSHQKSEPASKESMATSQTGDENSSPPDDLPF